MIRLKTGRSIVAPDTFSSGSGTTGSTPRSAAQLSSAPRCTSGLM